VHTIGILSVVFIGFEIATSVWGVIVAVAPIVAIDSWLKTQKMGRRIKKLVATTVTMAETEKVVDWSVCIQ